MYDGCKWPWTGLTIDPQGYIALCCNTNERKYLKTHISDIDDIETFFYESEHMERARKEFLETGWRKLNHCVMCQLGKGDWTMETANKLTGFNLSYLEFSMSNICNQMCVTCSSYFSNKWIKQEPLFGRTANDMYSLTDKDIKTLEKGFSTLEQLQLKGGEPLADSRNIKFLETLFEVNDKAFVTMCSNMQNIPKKFWDLLKKHPTRFKMMVSMDGLGKQFDWVRGGDFDKVMRNCKGVYEITGEKLYVNTVASIYTIKNLKQILDYTRDTEFLQNSYDHLDKVLVCLYPRWASHVFVMEQDEYMDCIKDIPYCKLHEEKCQVDKYEYDQYVKHTSTMNGIRGFDINAL